MKVFISYSGADLNMVRGIHSVIKDYAEVYYWDQNKEPGQDAWASIFSWINRSDLVIALITGRTVARGISVGSEIGHARAKSKTIIPLVSDKVPESELGCLKGVTYKQFDEENPTEALQKIEYRILRRKSELDIQVGIAVVICCSILLWLAARNR